MSRNANWKSFVILGVAVAILITSGGLVMASNFGFKINKIFYPNGVSLTTQAPKRDNWISLPFNSPYTDTKKLCTALGASLTTQIAQLNPSTGTLSPNVSCAATAAALNPLAGIRVRAGATPNTAGAVMVGSSDESKAWPTILGGFTPSQAPKKDNWISIPYHTTLVTAENVCTYLGLATGQGTIIRINADPAASGNAVSHPCGNTTIFNFSLVIGEAIDIRKTTAGDIVGKLPPHF
jgi:hypothetical protein